MRPVEALVRGNGLVNKETAIRILEAYGKEAVPEFGGGIRLMVRGQWQRFFRDERYERIQDMIPSATVGLPLDPMDSDWDNDFLVAMAGLDREFPGYGYSREERDV